MDQPIFTADIGQDAPDYGLFQEAEELKREKEELRRQKQELEKLKADVECKSRILEREAKLFEMKWKLLESETANLAKERAEFDDRVQTYQTTRIEDTSSDTLRCGLLFRGVTNELALKKRYKDLMKIYHPDNVAGDTNLVQEISREYEEMQTLFRAKY